MNKKVAEALRALQQLDEIESLQYRELLLEAEDALGEVLGLTCTGTAEGAGFYDHSGGTCPIHEWLVPADQPKAEALALAREGSARV